MTLAWPALLSLATDREVAIMRTCLLLITILLISCGGDGGSNTPTVQHVPDITGVVLTPNQAMALDGDGSVTVTVEVGYTDGGGDIETLWVGMPDGTTLEFAETATTEQGTLTEQISVSTATIGPKSSPSGRSPSCR